MIEVTATKNGYGTDTAEADSPEGAVLAAQTLSDDIRNATGSRELVECRFDVEGGGIWTRWF